MRITNGMMVSQFLTDANSSLNRLSKAQSQVNSTRRVTSISDDPQAVMQALKARNKLSSIEAYQGNIETTTSYLKEAESSTDELNEILQTVYERVTSALSGSKTQEDLDVIAEELTQLQAEFISVGNTTVGTSYIFGGHNYTGTTNGISSTPPFEVDASGDLIYNGVNLSQISWAAEFEANAGLITLSGGYASTLSAGITLSTSSDAQARDTQCADALSTLSDLIAAGQAALDAAEGFGIKPGDAEYDALDQLINGVGELNEDGSEPAGYVAGLADYYDQLYSETTKELRADSSVAALSTEFDTTKAQAILDTISATVGSAGSGVYQAIDDIQSAMNATTSYTDGQAALALEQAKSSALYTSATQTAQFTYSGTELLGEGTENVYHILDKVINMIKEGDTDSLSGMVDDLQAAQSRVLCFQTNIGATMNTLELISSRYESSTLNYKEMKSNAIDADMAEAYTNFTTAQTVYSAALAAGAEIVQTSLLDFLS